MSPGLKALCGGEALPPRLAAQLLERCPELWNVYGPTETTIWSTCERVLPDRPITIGRPIGNTQLYIVDERLTVTPVGVPGELCIGGDGVATGYLDRPELTAEKFVANPYAPGTRVYRTGDLARRRVDGTVEFMGRLDHQVKIRGFRIELGEIESRLARHPDVSVCVVVALEDAPGDEKRLVAYYELREQSRAQSHSARGPSARELREHLAQTLPPYMIPAVFHPVESLPLTPNGKIDRARLPAPQAGAEPPGERVEARDELEAQLIAIWQDVLKLPHIGVTDDFFDLGVSSIGAARLFAEIEKRIGSQLPLGAVFRAPTVEKLATLVRGRVVRNDWTSLIPIQPEGTQPPFFCVHGGAGTVLHLQPLARQLGDDQPFYAFQAQGLYGDLPPHATIEEMAAHYIREMRTVAAEGPYLLGGYCFGAIVAWEMAVQLEAAGLAVGPVVMFNGASPEYIRRWGTLLEQAEQERSQTRPRPVAWQGRARRRAVRAYVTLRRRYRRTRRAIERRRVLSTGRCVPEHMRDMFFIDMGHILERSHHPGPFTGDALLFSGRGLYRQPELGWNGMGARLHAIEIAGDHRDQRELMKDPAVVEVARQLREHLHASRATAEAEACA
jgi:thioesterase domain-containing protein/acyl carrier protein